MKYHISDTYKAAGVHIVLTPAEITEDNFWTKVEKNTREVTKTQPEKYEQILSQVKEHLNSGVGPLTIGGQTFEIIT
ncbi:MAG: hypothetical protein FD170_3356 [Bacteroidetes bacterium]|nr:MAG: hypothetical protein FD170_3356 [Bacteroidota bacterium]